MAVTGGGPAAPAAALAAQLDAIRGVQGTVVVRLVPGLTIPGTFHDLGGDGNGHFSPVPASVTLGVDSIYVGTDGSTAAIEQARSVLEDSRAYPVLSAPSTPGDRSR